jgi:hypothetical protein
MPIGTSNKGSSMTSSTLTIHLRIKNGNAKINALAFLKHATHHHANALLQALVSKKAVTLVDNQWHAMMTFSDFRRVIETFDDQFKPRSY